MTARKPGLNWEVGNTTCRRQDQDLCTEWTVLTSATVFSVSVRQAALSPRRSSVCNTAMRYSGVPLPAALALIS